MESDSSLMDARGVFGNEAASLLLGCLKTFRQIIEFVAKDRQLVVAAHIDFVGIISLLNDAHGVHNAVQTPGERI